MRRPLLKLQFHKAVFLFLLPLFFVLHGCVQHFPLIPFDDALLLTLEYELAAVLIAVLFYLVLKSWTKAVLFSFFLMCFQFFFGALHDGLKWVLPDTFFSKYSFILPLSLIVIIMAFILLKKTRKKFLVIQRYLNITIVTLIAIDFFGLCFKMYHMPATDHPQNVVACNDCPRPNIYLIITDEYAGNSELKDLFSFNNSSFGRELMKRGFFVATAPKSNYNFTPYSMASLFNMNYLEGISDKSNDLHNQKICFQTINDNELTRTLKELGYQFVNLSLFDFAGKSNISNHGEFYSSRGKILTGETFTGRIKKDLWFHLVTTFKLNWAAEDYLNNLRDNIDYQLKSTIKESESAGKPRFVYTHLIMPHYPYLYDSSGNKLQFDKALNGGKQAYLGFLQYCNKKCLALIDSIQKNDQSDPVILLMSDHGFTKYSSEEADPHYNFTNIFNVCLPSRNYSGFTDTIYNVNIFRVLLNSQFRQHLPLLKDSSIFLKEY